MKDEFELRGILASLLCWHRLTQAEAEDLLRFVAAQPAQERTWVGLTPEQKSELWEISRAALPRYATYASLVEAKLKEKNT